MRSENTMTRRESIKKLLRLWSGLSLGASAIVSWQGIKTTRAFADPGSFLVDGVGQTQGYSVKALTRETFDAAGGMGKFVSRGDVVAIKPNISWARAPQFAATTHPDVLQAAAWVSTHASGSGAVRELIEFMLKAQNRWDEVAGPLLA